MTSEEIIGIFGGTSALAAALGVPITTVHSWKANGFVPLWRQPKILELAIDRRLPISATDFPTERRAA